MNIINKNRKREVEKAGVRIYDLGRGVVEGAEERRNSVTSAEGSQ